MLETIEPLIKSWLDGVVKESILQPYVAVVDEYVGGESALEAAAAGVPPGQGAELLHYGSLVC